jgi:carbon monoxide dehydrogenase subunit G
MDFSGSQTIKAPRPQVFKALLDAEVIKNSVPGAEAAEYVEYPTGRQIKLTIAVNLPGIKGSHTIFLETGEVVEPSRVTLITEPSSGLGSVKATCTVDLAETADGTLLTYNAHADRTGAVAAIPDLVIKGAAKPALDTFFKNFEKQVSTINA